MTQWRPLDSRFAQLERRLTQHRRWLEKETESQIQDFAEIEHERKNYVRSLHRQAEASVDTGDLEERLAKRIKRVTIIQKWLSSSSRPPASEKTCMEHLGSCNWFFGLAKYRKWKGQQFDRHRANDTSILQGDWHDRVLFVQGEILFTAAMTSLTAFS